VGWFAFCALMVFGMGTVDTSGTECTREEVPHERDMWYIVATELGLKILVSVMAELTLLRIPRTMNL
jgi:hypothetical protein